MCIDFDSLPIHLVIGKDGNAVAGNPYQHYQLPALVVMLETRMDKYSYQHYQHYQKKNITVIAAKNIKVRAR